MFHSHRLSESGKYVQPDAANFNSWRRHVRLLGDPPDEVVHSWEDVKAMFNGGTRKRMMSSSPMGSGPESPPGQSPPSISHHGYHSPPPPRKQVKTEVRDLVIRYIYNLDRFIFFFVYSSQSKLIMSQIQGAHMRTWLISSHGRSCRIICGPGLLIITCSGQAARSPHSPSPRTWARARTSRR